MKLKEIFHLLLFIYSQLNLQLCLPWLEGVTESSSMPITWLFQPQPAQTCKVSQDVCRAGEDEYSSRSTKCVLSGGGSCFPHPLQVDLPSHPP